MAFIEVSYCFLDDPEFFDLLVDSFETVKEVKDDPCFGRKTIQVTHPELPDSNDVICPVFYEFNGVRPFIISFNQEPMNFL